MTALAMIIGMIPMALGLGEGAEQNAPLGRAVIGGLLFATVSTLFFVPVVFAGIHQRLARKAARAPRRAPPAGGLHRKLPPMTENRHSSIGIHHAAAGAAPRRCSARHARAWRGARRWSSSCCSRWAPRARSSPDVLHARDLRSDHGRAGDHLRQRRRRRRPATGGESLSLPGTLQGFVESPIYARTDRLRACTGTHDIGAHVAKGELLAELETPEVDQQLAQAHRRARAGRLQPGAGQEHRPSAGRACASAMRSRSRNSTNGAARSARPRPISRPPRQRGAPAQARGLQAHRGAVCRRRSRGATSTSAT